MDDKGYQQLSPPTSPVPPAPGTEPPEDYNPKQRVSNELSVMQAGEQIVCNVKRHPIGLIGIYIMMAVLLIVAAILAFAVGPSLANSSGNSDMAMKAGAAIFAIIAVIAGVYGLIATWIYRANSWVVTSDSITQIAQSGLFRRQSSQLALADIEDITAEQNGVFSHMFNYGMLRAETAGHQSKFVFPFCPNPNFYAQRILEAREAEKQETPEAERQEQGTP